MTKRLFKIVLSILVIVLALSFGLFAVSCGGNDNAEEEQIEEIATQQPTEKPTEKPVQQKQDLTLSEIQQRGYIVVACEASEPPYLYVKKDGFDYDIIGPEYEFIKLIADDLGVELVVKSVKQSDILVGVQTGLYDIGLSVSKLSLAEKETIELSTTYFVNEYPVIIPIENEGKYEDLSVFKDLRVATMGRHEEYYLVKEAAHKYAKVKYYGNEPLLIKHLIENYLKAACLPAYKARYYVDKYPDELTYMEGVVLKPDEESGRNISISKEKQDLAAYVNEMLKKQDEEEFLLSKMGISVTDYSINQLEIDNACTDYVGVLYGK